MILLSERERGAALCGDPSQVNPTGWNVMRNTRAVYNSMAFICRNIKAYRVIYFNYFVPWESVFPENFIERNAIHYLFLICHDPR